MRRAVPAGGSQKLEGFPPVELADLSRDLVDVQVWPVVTPATLLPEDHVEPPLPFDPDGCSDGISTVRIGDPSNPENELVGVSEERLELACTWARKIPEELPDERFRRRYAAPSARGNLPVAVIVEWRNSANRGRA
jgi:hypothetical protein